MRDVRESGDLQTSGRLSRVRQFSLTSFHRAQRVVVRACGRLILGQGADEPLWASHVDQSTATDVALDLSCVNDVDARGLGLLAGLVRRAREHSAIVSVIAASRVVQRLAEMTRLDRAIPGAWHERRGVPGCGAVRQSVRNSGNGSKNCHTVLNARETRSPRSQLFEICDRFKKWTQAHPRKSSAA